MTEQSVVTAPPSNPVFGGAACAIVTRASYLLAYDLLPLTFAVVALLAGGGLDAPGRRVVRLVYWTPPPSSLRLGPITCPVPR